MSDNQPPSGNGTDNSHRAIPTGIQEGALPNATKPPLARPSRPPTFGSLAERSGAGLAEHSNVGLAEHSGAAVADPLLGQLGQSFPEESQGAPSLPDPGVVAPVVASPVSVPANQVASRQQSSSVLPDPKDVKGVAAFFEHPHHLMYAAEQARDSKYEAFDALSPFPIHGMDDALGVGRSWIPWVTFGAGLTGLSLAAMLEFGIMVFAWPLNVGGKPHASWPAFVPVMFELTVLIAGITTVLVMFKAAGCFKRPFIIDRRITDDTFCLWIDAEDANFERNQVIEFMKTLNPVEIRTVTEGAK